MLDEKKSRIEDSNQITFQKGEMKITIRGVVAIFLIFFLAIVIILTLKITPIFFDNGIVNF